MSQAGIVGNGGIMGEEEPGGEAEEDTADTSEMEMRITAKDSNDSGSRTLLGLVWLLPLWLLRWGFFLWGISSYLFLTANPRPSDFLQTSFPECILNMEAPRNTNIRNSNAPSRNLLHRS